MVDVIYRICDLRDGQTKIAQISKRQCFLNFIEVFGNACLTVVADNTRSETIEFLKRYTTDLHQTRLGNSKSFLYAAQLAAQRPKDRIVYLLEDDYLHLPDAAQCIVEALAHADYVSLYDHADKYLDPSPNPLVQQGGENTRVILTKTCHWKYTNSTTMTFACKAATLQEDLGLMTRFCQEAIPLDFHMFMELQKRGRRLLTPIPGCATHCDHMPSPFFFERFAAARSAGTVPVVIPYYKNQRQLDKCRQHLEQQNVPVTVFVRDNTHDNIYFTAAVNEGLQRFMSHPGEYIIVLNQDMYLAPTAVSQMVAFMDSHPRCGIGAPLQLHPQHSDYVIWGGSEQAFPAGVHQHGPLSEFKENQPVLWANGACLILRKSMMAEIGLLDPNLAFIGSDSDYSFTARSRGWEVWRIAEAWGIHEHGASAASGNRVVEAQKLQDMIYFARKWMNAGLYDQLAGEKYALAEDQIRAMTLQMEQTRQQLLQSMPANGAGPHAMREQSGYAG